MDPREPAAAFFKVVGLVLDAALPGAAAARLESETRWAAIVIGLARLGSLHSASADQRLGRVLAEAGYSEQRLARLLEGDAQRLVDELPSLARYLAAKSLSVDWTGATRLILSAGHDDEDQTRRHIARDYYGTLARQEGH
jgi:CRISPR system Cascade subunit CasB